MAGYEFARTAMRTWYAANFARSGDVPKPVDDPAATAQHPDADRVLLVGNGPCHGWGVVSHQLALTGQLSRALAAPGAGPAAVDYVGDERMNIRSARAWIGRRDLRQYDAVSIVIGVSDAVRLTPVAQWRRELTSLLGHLRENLRDGVPILVSGIQPIRTVAVYSGPLGRVAQWHADRLNAVTEAVTADLPLVTYAPLTGRVGTGDRPLGSRDMYDAWARELAQSLTPLLAESLAARAERTVAEVPTWQWPVTPVLAEKAKQGGPAELQRIADLAQTAFDVEFAVVTLLDGDRLWYANNTHILPQSLPRELAYCNTTIQQDDALLIPDSNRDSRFNTNPLVEMIGLPFYLGLPLRSRTGEKIGTFCILGGRPKEPGDVSIPLFRQFAQEAQDEVWRIEDETVSASQLAVVTGS